MKNATGTNIVSKYLFHFSVIYIIVINLSSMIFFLGQLNIYKLLFIYPFTKFVTPHELPQKYRKRIASKKKITDPPEMFMFHGSTSQVSFQVDLRVPHPFRPPGGSPAILAPNSISCSTMLANPGSLEMVVHVSVVYLHWVSNWWSLK